MRAAEGWLNGKKSVEAVLREARAEEGRLEGEKFKVIRGRIEEKN